MSKHQTKLIQHLGIIAELCHEVQLAEYIDELILKEKHSVSTTFTLHGKYNSEDESIPAGVIQITNSRTSFR